MSEESLSGVPAGSDSIRALGLVANPFDVAADDPDSVLHALDDRARVNRVLVAVDRAAELARPRPVWLECVPGTTDPAIAGVVSRGVEIGVLAVRLGLLDPSGGRVRAALKVLAEKVADDDFDATLAALARYVADQEPDTDLDSWALLGDAAWQGFIDLLETNPAAALEGRFESSVSKAEESAEEDSEPPKVVVDGVAAYLIEYVRVHRSRVLARAIAARVLRGPAAAADELAATKAPRKTLEALAWLATLRFRCVVFVCDGFDGFNAADERDRLRIALSYAELRVLIGRGGLMVFSVPTREALELDDLFGGDERLAPFEPKAAEMVDAARVEAWIDSAGLRAEPHSITGTSIERALEESAGDVKTFQERARGAIEDAATRGMRRID